MASSADKIVRTASGGQVQYGNHVDTIDSVDLVFRAQRKLSFTFALVFFVVTLAIPAMTLWWSSWYAVPIRGGFTANYLVVSLVYYFFLWGLSYLYLKKADSLDDPSLSSPLVWRSSFDVSLVRPQTSI